MRGRNLGLVLQRDRPPSRGGRGVRARGAARSLARRHPRQPRRPRSSRRAQSRGCRGDRAPRRSRATPRTPRRGSSLALALQPQGRMLEALEAVTRAASARAGGGGIRRAQGAARERHRRAGQGARARSRTRSRACRCRPRCASSSRSLLEYKLGRACRSRDGVRADPAARSRRTAPRCRSSRSCAGALPTGATATTLVQRYRAAVAARRRTRCRRSRSCRCRRRAPSSARCARTLDGAAGRRRASARAAVARRASACASAIFRPTSTPTPRRSSPRACSSSTIARASRSSRIPTGPDDRSPMRARLVRAFDRFVDVRDRDPLAVADIDPQRRASTSWSTSRVIRRTRRRSCSRSGPRRSRFTTWAIRARSRAGSSTT